MVLCRKGVRSYVQPMHLQKKLPNAGLVDRVKRGHFRPVDAGALLPRGILLRRVGVGTPREEM